MGRSHRPKTIAEASPRELAALAADGWWPFERAVTRTAVTPPNGVYEAWVNNRYSVQVSDSQTEWGRVIHLWVRRHDGGPVRSWADLQRIKNEVLVDGAQRTAVEVFPAAADLVDDANLYHLWVLPPDFRLPFGLRKVAPDAR